MSATLHAIGWKAHAALALSGGRLDALPALAGSRFRFAGDEPVWIGTAPVAMHPRAIVLDAAGECDRVCTRSVTPWRIAEPRLDSAAQRALRDGCVALAGQLRCVGESGGFLAMLTAEPLTFPHDRMSAQVVALAESIDRDDADAAFEASLPLLGFGPGLTPSGDDLVGAALYARRLSGADARWQVVAQRLVDAARTRTHAISAALFRDLIEGQSFAALNRLATVLATGSDVVPAAREVAAIGHSSGADMLAGFIVGAAGTAALQRKGVQ